MLAFFTYEEGKVLNLNHIVDFDTTDPAKTVFNLANGRSIALTGTNADNLKGAIALHITNHIKFLDALQKIKTGIITPDSTAQM